MRQLVLLLLWAGAAIGQTTIGYPSQGGTCPFPGCRQGAVAAGVVDVTQLPYGAVNTGQADATGAIQAAIDSGAATIYFPPGTYAVCNLMPRDTSQTWQGAGRDDTIFTAFGNCNNLVVNSFGGLFPGPVYAWTVKGIGFRNANNTMLAISCREVARVNITDCAFDTGPQSAGTCSPSGGVGPAGIALTGCRDYVIADNEFYSTCPGGGGQGMTLVGVRAGVIQRNTSNWQRTFISVGSATNQNTEYTDISNNIYHGTFWGIPTKYTNSGATVTYAGGVMTDTAAAFQGICGTNEAAPAACAAAAGSFVRAMTSKATGVAANFNTGGYLTDTTAGFIVAGVRRGDIVKTANVCLGNGALGLRARNVCAGGAGTGSWGDSCVCTANADCASATCEPRFATVEKVNSATSIQLDELVRDTACTLGPGVCARANRRPTGPILTLTGVSYTIYGWSACQITSYTATTTTCNSDGWFAWDGAAAAPANATLYEVMYPRPLYFLLAGATVGDTVEGLRVVNNIAVGGFADHFELTGKRIIVANNQSKDCGDTCFVFGGDQYTVTGNIAEHCGARGMIAVGNDQVWTSNVALDSPWMRVSNASTAGDINVTGLRNTLTGNVVKTELPTNLARYGYVSFGTATDNIFANNTCSGAYSVGCYRFDGAASTANHIIGYHGETISNNGGTYSIEGGKVTQAQLANLVAALLPLNGSTVGCSDCAPIAIGVPSVCGAGTGALARWGAGAVACF